MSDPSDSGPLEPPKKSYDYAGDDDPIPVEGIPLPVPPNTSVPIAKLKPPVTLPQSSDDTAPVTESPSPSSLFTQGPAVASATPPPPIAPSIPQDSPDARTLRVGIAGASGAGKSYLFQSMVHRAWYGRQSGALQCLLGESISRMRPPEEIQTVIDSYRKWVRLQRTVLDKLYVLNVRYRRGYIGEDTGELDVSYLDGMGEEFKSGNRELYRAAFLGARLMVFCVPLWAIFPDLAVLSEADRADLKYQREGFAQVLQHYEREIVSVSKTSKPKVIVALTMADDERSRLIELRQKWVAPFLRPEDIETVQKTLGSQRGLNEYLAAARQISRYMTVLFQEHKDKSIAQIPDFLAGFSKGEPWIIPMAAVDGARLRGIETATPELKQLRIEEAGEPVPAHVELPLLVALSDVCNALM